MITKTIILSTADWLEVSFDDTKDANGFTFRANADIEFAEVPSPAIDEIITLASGNSYGFDAPKGFWIRGAIGTEIYLSPFDSIAGGGGGSGGSCSFDGVYQQPSGHVTGTSCQDWVDLHFPSQPPTMSLRGTPAFGLYEVGQTLSTPLIEGRGTLGSNPAGILTNLSIVDPVFAQANPTPGTWYGTNDINIAIILGNTKTYSGQVDDDQGRSANASGSYNGAYPYYGTSVDITTLTKQTLVPNTNTYFQIDMVAETGGDKYKADFENANVTITGVQFYNTISGAWERMGGSKANSLTLRDTTAVTHTVQGNVINYTRFTQNGPDGGALQTRFYTN